MNVQVKLFAAARELAGADVVTVETGERPTVADVRAAIVEREPRLGPLVAASLLAVNAEYARNDAPIGPRDELALIPPVSGG
jgi:molybdopterin converting factor small subunit